MTAGPTVWRRLGRREIYASPWVGVDLVDVDTGLRRFEHHLVVLPPSVGALVVRDDHVLMMWRHRFLTGSWGWELPGGWADPGEEPAAAAGRETEEETGWRPRGLRHMFTMEPIAGITDALQHVFRSDDAEEIGRPTDPDEQGEIAWVPVDQLLGLLDDGLIVGGVSVAAVLRLLAGRGPVEGYGAD